MALHPAALETLKTTSRTFFIPISRLPDGLQEAVGSAYLCMRAIDEVEDHPSLDNISKAKLLRSLSLILQAQTSVEHFQHQELNRVFNHHSTVLPEVTIRLGDWACCAPAAIAPRIWDAAAATADRMAHWAGNGWKIANESDLDSYTYGVAGAVGVLVCDLWGWFSGGQLDRAPAIQFGRGLQSVNILRNRADDLGRGVDFFPAGWGEQEMQRYARRNLAAVEAYKRVRPDVFFTFMVDIPKALALATLDSLARGESKLSRTAVQEIIAQLDSA